MTTTRVFLSVAPASVRDCSDRYGISGDRIQTRGLGKSSPVADNGSEAGRQQNRAL